MRWLDVTALVAHLNAGGQPTGIHRYSLELCNALFGPESGFREQFSLCGFSHDGGSLFSYDFQDILKVARSASPRTARLAGTVRASKRARYEKRLVQLTRSWPGRTGFWSRKLFTAAYDLAYSMMGFVRHAVPELSRALWLMVVRAPPPKPSVAAGSAITIAPGDIIVCLAVMTPDRTYLQNFASMRARGVKVLYVLQDLLPISFPWWFPDEYVG